MAQYLQLPRPIKPGPGLVLARDGTLRLAEVTAYQITSVAPSVIAPGITSGQIVSVAASTLTGTLAIGHGGTGLSATPTNGQLPIGNGSGYTLAALTAGTGVTITNASGSITVAASAAVPQAVTDGGLMHAYSNWT